MFGCACCWGLAGVVYEKNSLFYKDLQFDILLYPLEFEYLVMSHFVVIGRYQERSCLCIVEYLINTTYNKR